MAEEEERRRGEERPEGSADAGPTDETPLTGDGAGAAPADEVLPTGAEIPAGAQAALPPGVPGTFARYRILAVIGRGGSGIVYRAYDPSLDRDVALKVLIAGEGASPEQIKRFFREAASAARLHHPNIVPIHELDVFEGKHYFTMDCIGGSGLDRIIKREGLEPRKALEMAEEIARAVHYAHEHGIIHRDLKPSNIIVDKRGEPHVTDFGLAKELGEEEGLTRAGTILGTPSYMSPEQAAGKKHVDARSDVYSLGAVLYEMLSERPPFVAETLMGLLRMAVEEEPVPPTRLGVKVSADAETICLKCLEKDPERRYQTAGELADDLRRFLNAEPILARRAGLFYRLRKRLWKRRALVGGISAALVAGVFAVGFGLGFFERLSRLAAGWELVVDEDFSAGGLPAGWEVLDGWGEIREGQLFVTDSQNRGFAVLLPGECPEAVRLEYDAYFPEGIELGDETCDLSALLHCLGERPVGTGYVVQFGAAGNRRAQICREGPEVIWNSVPGARIAPGRRHSVAAEHAGEYVTLTVDGHEVLRLRDFFPLKGGRVGIYSWGKGARFVRVRLWRRGRALDISSLALPDAFYVAGQYGKAAEEYEAIYRSHPDEPEGMTALYKGALGRMMTGDDSGAGKAFERLLKTPMAGWAHIGLAEIEARAAHGDQAVEELRLAEGSGDPEAAAQVRANAIRLAHEAASRTDTAAAAALLEKARDGLHHWEEARLAERTMLSASEVGKAGSPETAVSLYRAVLGAFPDTHGARAEVAFELGRALFQAGRFDEAILVYEGVEKKYSDQRGYRAMAADRKGRVLVAAGRFDEAIETCRRLETDYPENRYECSSAAFTIGNALRAGGRLEEAVEAYDRVEEAYPEQGGQRALARLWRGVVRSALGDRERGKTDWRSAVRDYEQLDPRTARLARFFLGELDEAVFLENVASGSRDRWNDAAFDVAEKFEAEGKQVDAARWYRKCLELTQGREWPAFLARRRLEGLRAGSGNPPQR